MLPTCQVAVYLIRQISLIDTGMLLRAHWVEKNQYVLTLVMHMLKVCKNDILMGENIYSHVSFRLG